MPPYPPLNMPLDLNINTRYNIKVDSMENIKYTSVFKTLYYRYLQVPTWFFSQNVARPPPPGGLGPNAVR